MASSYTVTLTQSFPPPSYIAVIGQEEEEEGTIVISSDDDDDGSSSSSSTTEDGDTIVGDDEAGDQQQRDDHLGEEGEGEEDGSRDLIEGIGWHPVISRVFWADEMLNITYKDWRSVGKGCLTPGDIYYLILAAPCLLAYFPTLVMRECFRTFEENNPWVCNICLLRFRFADQVIDHHDQAHGGSQKGVVEEKGGAAAKGDEEEEDVNPFPDGNPIVDYYSGYVSQDYDLQYFWCSLCNGLGFEKFTLWCHHVLTEHVRYFSACRCALCVDSPTRTYHWVDFLHGKAPGACVFEGDGTHMNRVGWGRPISVAKRCPADPDSCPMVFRKNGEDLDSLVLHLITYHGW